MNKEELLKEIMGLPKIETNNLISAMNSINVDDLMSAIDRFNKIPDYNDLLKENQKYKEVIEKIKTRYCDYYGTKKEINDDCVLRNVLKEISDILKEVE